MNNVFKDWFSFLDAMTKSSTDSVKENKSAIKFLTDVKSILKNGKHNINFSNFVQNTKSKKKFFFHSTAMSNGLILMYIWSDYYKYIKKSKIIELMKNGKNKNFYQSCLGR